MWEEMIIMLKIGRCELMHDANHAIVRTHNKMNVKYKMYVEQNS
jgi:hypothetical protein